VDYSVHEDLLQDDGSETQDTITSEDDNDSYNDRE
jgi:hypothetical protein